MPTVERGDASLHYELYGEGPAVALVHGGAGNTLVWWQQIPHLARRRRVLVFDHRGFGRSRCAPERIDPRDFADDLRAILDAAGIERASLVCQSMGGWTGLRFALRWPQRVVALVLCGTPGGVFTEKVLAGLAAGGRRAAEGGLAAAAVASDFPVREPARAHLYRAIMGLNTPLEATPLGRGIVEARVGAEELRGFAVPTLLVAGDQDVFFPPDALAEVAARIPGAKVEVLEGVGHSSYYEVPERFNALVERFLDAADGGGQRAKR